jgi:hypothetical protein
MAAPLKCGHFLERWPTIMDKDKQGSEPTNMATIVIASIITADLISPFIYGFFGWIVSE